MPSFFVHATVTGSQVRRFGGSSLFKFKTLTRQRVPRSLVVANPVWTTDYYYWDGTKPVLYGEWLARATWDEVTYYELYWWDRAAQEIHFSVPFVFAVIFSAHVFGSRGSQDRG